MAHHQLASNIARLAKLSLYFLFTITLFKIKAIDTNSSVLAFPTGISERESILLYFEGLIHLDLSSGDQNSLHTLKNDYTDRYLDLLSRVKKSMAKLSADDPLGFKFYELIERLQVDIFLQDRIENDEKLPDYVMNYAFANRRSSFYSLEMDVMIAQVQDRKVSESELLDFFRVVLYYLEGLYKSGLINSFRKNEQTYNHRLLEKMLAYLSQQNLSNNGSLLVQQIFMVSRYGNLMNNRHSILKGGVGSMVFTSLLKQIEPVEKLLYQCDDPIKLAEYQKERNLLREKYLRMVESFDASKTLEQQNENILATTISFVAGIDHIYQQVSDGRGGVQLIQHKEIEISKYVYYIRDEMDQALHQFEGEARKLGEINYALKSMFNQIIKPIELELAPRILISVDGSLCYFPFEMMLDGEGKFFFENHEVSYHFDQGGREQEVLAETVHSVNGKYIGDLRLKGIEAGSMDNELAFDEFSYIASNKSILYLSAHQVFDNHEPYILLNNWDSISLKNWFDIPDILGVLLSMCAGFRGKLIAGENSESFGVRAYEAGAENVISSLWSVDDYATSTLMQYFMNNLQNGMPSGKSLRLAKLNYLKGADIFHQHPVFWASFVHYGREYRIKKGLNLNPALFFLFLPVLLLMLNFRIRIQF